MIDDAFDPNTWKPSLREFRIYGDDNAQTWAVLDEEDYLWAVKWRWCWKRSRGGKLYLRRAISQYLKGYGKSHSRTLYLHIEIMKRVKPQPTLFDLVDHRDGDSTNNRRRNLRWATYSMNARNIFGSHAVELYE